MRAQKKGTPLIFIISWTSRLESFNLIEPNRKSREKESCTSTNTQDEKKKNRIQVICWVYLFLMRSCLRWWITPVIHWNLTNAFWFDVHKLQFMNEWSVRQGESIWCACSFIFRCQYFTRPHSVVCYYFSQHCEYFDRRKLISNQLNEITQFYKVYAVIKSSDVLFFHNNFFCFVVVVVFFTACSVHNRPMLVTVRIWPQIVVWLCRLCERGKNCWAFCWNLLLFERPLAWVRGHWNIVAAVLLPFFFPTST